MEISLEYKTPSIDANELFAASTLIAVSVRIHAKLCTPRLLSPVPIFTVLRACDDMNVPLSVVITLFGIETEFKYLLLANA